MASDRTYGARRVWRALLADAADCGLPQIEQLVRLQGLRARRRWPAIGNSRACQRTCWTGSSRPMRPNQKCIADFTSLWTVEGLARCGSSDRPVLATADGLVDERRHDG